MSGTTTAKATPDVLADFKVAPARKAQFKPREGARPVACEVVGKSASVHRGERVRDGLPVLYLENGDATMSLPLSAIGAAIAGGLITSEEIAALTA